MRKMNAQNNEINNKNTVEIEVFIRKSGLKIDRNDE